MYRLLQVVVTAFIACSASAGTIAVPKNIHVGANYVWHLSQAKHPLELTKFQGAKISNSPTVLAQITQANRSLKSLRATLEPSVDVVHQIPYSIDIGEQKIIYRVYSRTSGSAFYELHILGKEQEPTIAGVRELNSDQVINLMTKSKVIAIPQR